MWGDDRRRISRAFGRRVRELREALSCTEEMLGRRLNITLQVVRRVEAGTAYVSLFTIVRLAQALEIEPLELLRSTAEGGTR